MKFILLFNCFILSICSSIFFIFALQIKDVKELLKRMCGNHELKFELTTIKKDIGQEYRQVNEKVVENFVGMLKVRKEDTKFVVRMRCLEYGGMMKKRRESKQE